MLNFSSYILYLLLLAISYFTFGFTLDTKLSTCYLTFTLLSLTSYVLYLLLLTIHQLAFGFTFRYKIRKIIQSSVLSFLKVVNFLLPSLCSVYLVLLGRKPDARGFSTNYAKFFCLFLWLCINVLHNIGECCESVPLDRTGSYISKYD